MIVCGEEKPNMTIMRVVKSEPYGGLTDSGTHSGVVNEWNPDAACERDKLLSSQEVPPYAGLVLIKSTSSTKIDRHLISMRPTNWWNKM